MFVDSKIVILCIECLPMYIELSEITEFVKQFVKYICSVKGQNKNLYNTLYISHSSRLQAGSTM